MRWDDLILIMKYGNLIKYNLVRYCRALRKLFSINVEIIHAICESLWGPTAVNISRKLFTFWTSSQATDGGLCHINHNWQTDKPGPYKGPPFCLTLAFTRRYCDWCDRRTVFSHLAEHFWASWICGTLSPPSLPTCVYTGIPLCRCLMRGASLITCFINALHNFFNFLCFIEQLICYLLVKLFLSKSFNHQLNCTFLILFSLKKYSTSRGCHYSWKILKKVTYLICYY